MRQTAWSARALAEFQKVVGYIARDNPAAAERVADRIEAVVGELAARPTGRPGRVEGTYEKLVHRLPYIIAYALEDDADVGGRLTILRIVHGARNWPAGAWPAP